MTTIPKIYELQAKAAEILAAHAFISDAGIPVVANDGNKRKRIEGYLNNGGAVIEVLPEFSAQKRDQSGTAWIVDCTLIVLVKVNPKENADTDNDGLGVNAMQVAVEVARALCATTRHPGGEFFKISSDAITLSTFEEGLLEYVCQFTKEGVPV